MRAGVRRIGCLAGFFGNESLCWNRANGGCESAFVPVLLGTRKASLAQLVEQLTLNQLVVGSSPTGGTSNKPLPLIAVTARVLFVIVLILYKRVTKKRESRKLEVTVVTSGSKSTVEEIRQRFDSEVERFSNLETGQSATIDSPLAMSLIAEIAAAVTAHATSVLDVGCGAGNYLWIIGGPPAQRPDHESTLGATCEHH